MGDLVNFYSLLPKDKQKQPIGFKNHLIDKNSRILMIGSSGTGKSNSLLNFIEKSSGEFSEIIICSFSTIDEALYKFLQEKIPQVQLINNIEEVPEVQSYDNEDKKISKLIVFDDFINLSKRK